MIYLLTYYAERLEQGFVKWNFSTRQKSKQSMLGLVRHTQFVYYIFAFILIHNFLKL